MQNRSLALTDKYEFPISEELIRNIQFFKLFLIFLNIKISLLGKNKGNFF